MTAPTEDLITLIEGRIGQDFDGEAHLTEEEARSVAQTLRALQQEVSQQAARISRFTAICGRMKWLQLEDGSLKPSDGAETMAALDDLAEMIFADALDKAARSALTGSAQG